MISLLYIQSTHKLKF